MNIIFAGTPDFAAQHLKGLVENGISISHVISQPDKPGKRGKKLIPSPVKVFAEAQGLPVMQPKKLRAEDIAPLNPDLLVVVAYGQILRQDLLDTPTHGCINVHGSLLPRWRGAAPIQRAVEAGDKESGICIMQMDAGLDTGPVLLESRTPIEPEDTSADLSSKLVELGIQGLLQVIKDIEHGNALAEPQLEDGATYAKKILKSEAALDWSLAPQQLKSKILAFNPDPLCYSYLQHGNDTLRVKIHSATTALLEANQQPPGTVLEVTSQGVLISAGEGALLIDKLQLPLGKGSVLSGQDILNSRADLICKGAQFTSRIPGVEN